MTGLPSLSTSGAIACTWVERIEPRKATMSILRGQFRERQHDAGIGGLVVFDDEFDLLAEHAAGLVDGCERKLGAVLRPKPLLGRGPRHRHAHADFDGGALRPRAGDDVGCCNTGCDAGREIASRKLHSFLPGAGLLCRPLLVLAVLDRTQNRVRLTDSRALSKLISRGVRLTVQMCRRMRRPKNNNA